MSIEDEGTNPGVKEGDGHGELSEKPTAEVQSKFSEDRYAIKLQSFVRGSLCRARVSLLVKKLIDDLMAQRAATLAESKSASSSAPSKEQASHLRSDTSRPPKDAQEHNEGNRDVLNVETGAEADKTPDAPSHLPDLDLPENPDNTSMNNEVVKKSVGDILSKFESKSDPNVPPPVRNWSPVKGKKSPVKPAFDDKSSLPRPPPAPLEQHSVQHSVRGKKMENNATRHVLSSEEILHQHEERMEAEIRQLLKDIRRVGEPGRPSVNFGALFDDDQVANYYEALVGTLKAAKKKGLVKYQGQVLLKGPSDDVVITITSFEG